VEALKIGEHGVLSQDFNDDRRKLLFPSIELSIGFVLHNISEHTVKVILDFHTFRIVYERPIDIELYLTLVFVRGKIPP